MKPDLTNMTKSKQKIYNKEAEYHKIRLPKKKKKERKMMVNTSLTPTPLFEFYNSNNTHDPL